MYVKLSIIIPLYNAEKYIKQCLNSVLKQNIPVQEYEILVIDDGSTDSTFSLTKEVTKSFNHIHLYSQKNKGVSCARNRGLQLAKGQYIYFIDGDDYIALNTLKILIDKAIINNLDILEFSNIRTQSRDLKNSKPKNSAINELNILKGNKYIASRFFHDAVWVYFYKRDFLLKTKLQFIEGRTKQDMFFNAELVSIAERVAFYPLDTYRYVINPNSISTRKDPKGLRRSIEDFIFITLLYNKLIRKLENKNVNTSILKQKQQTQLFNICKGLLQSDYKTYEIKKVLDTLKSENIYPLKAYYGKVNYRKYLTYLFNRKKLFYFSVWVYRLCKIPFNNILLKKYQSKREKKVMTGFRSN